MAGQVQDSAGAVAVGARAVTELTEAERDELAVMYRRLLRGVDALYDDPTPYISAWHQAPVHTGRDTVRLMLQFTSPRRAESRLKFLAGSEAAMGAFINDTTPESVAARLRDVASEPAAATSTTLTPEGAPA